MALGAGTQSAPTLKLGKAAPKGKMDAEENSLTISEEPLIPPIFELLGCRIHRVRMAEAVALSENFVASGSPHLIVTADSSAIVIAHQDTEFRQILNSADLVVPDSLGILWASHRLGQPLPERVPGIDLMDQLCARSAQKGWRVFLLGAEPGVAEIAGHRLQQRHPGLNIVGTHHGYFSPQEEEQIVQKIAQARPQLLFVAMGIPKQEKFLARHRDQLSASVQMGVGGSLDCFAGKVRRAPRWIQRRGLEWLFRLITNPRKISKVALLPRFVLLVLQSQNRRIYKKGV